jgi:hypothetical protein
MLITSTHPDAKHYRIYDCAGNVLPYVYSYDTETKEIEMAVCLKAPKELKIEDSGEMHNTASFLMQPNDKGDPALMLIKFVLPGSYLLKDGKEWNGEESLSLKEEEAGDLVQYN